MTATDGSKRPLGQASSRNVLCVVFCAPTVGAYHTHIFMVVHNNNCYGTVLVLWALLQYVSINLDARSDSGGAYPTTRGGG